LHSLELIEYVDAILSLVNKPHDTAKLSFGALQSGYLGFMVWVFVHLKKPWNDVCKNCGETKNCDRNIVKQARIPARLHACPPSPRVNRTWHVVGFVIHITSNDNHRKCCGCDRQFILGENNQERKKRLKGLQSWHLPQAKQTLPARRSI